MVFFTAPALCAIILREVSPGRVLTEQMIGRSEQNLSPAKCSAVETTRNTEIGSLTEVVVSCFLNLFGNTNRLMCLKVSIELLGILEECLSLRIQKYPKKGISPTGLDS